MAHDLFIGHSVKEKTTADAMCPMREADEIRRRIAPRGVTPGIEWRKCIVDAIRHARIMAPMCILAVLVSSGRAQQTRGLEAAPAQSGRRLALVIGNKSYPWKPLVNPVNDATDVAAALSGDGFNGGNVKPLFDLNEHDLKRAVREFVESVKSGDFAFLYYSGHGVEVKGVNYLLPVDLPADATEGEVEDEAVSAQRIAQDLESQGAAVKVLVLDACRDNPLRATKSAGGGGLASMEGLGSLIVFATEAGRTASDNTEGRNGLFTQYLLKALTRPGVSLDDALRDVARQVSAETNRRQVPMIYGLLEQPVILVGGPITVNVAPAQTAPDPCLEAWNTIKDSKDPQDYDDFAAACPNSQYTTPARLAANKLRRQAAPTQASAPSVSAPAKSPQLLANEANALIAHGSYAEARPLAEQACNGGEAAGCLYLGGLYFLGHGVATDYEQSGVLFQKACDGGNLEGCFSLGYLYQSGLGEATDYAKARALYQKACDGGNMNGCENLGTIYANAQGVALDYKQALALYQKACDNGNLDGCYSAGHLYEFGLGVRRDTARAAALLLRACSSGNQMYCDQLKELQK
jgi:TPR repeat protein